MRDALRLLRRLETEVVVGTGGYVCVPVVLAANLRRLPVVLMEQNAYPGRATRLLARRAHQVATSFAETARLLHGARVVHTGTPIRREVAQHAGTPLHERCRHVLVTGGSQGARSLNRAITGCVRRLLEADADLRVTHQCGALDWPEVRAAAAALPPGIVGRYMAAPFFDDMGERIAQSDVVVMRGGGSSLAECSALGRPMILVPYPHAGGHQRFNIVPFVRAGAAVSVGDAECTPERLQGELSALFDDPERWRTMARASTALGKPDASRRVVALVQDAAAARTGHAA
jgi:UDP-N-acetylglucosamine--N-acetylmuramyl-(pentapeptide) pyrophosphoryl-undecaprenol N-acetylglucosamine transferase